MTRDSFDWLSLLHTSTERFGDLVQDADPDAPVPTCPDWSLRDLVAHLGGVHRWAAHAVVEGNPDLRPEPPTETGPAELAAWYRRHAAQLLDVLTATAPDAHAWTLDDRDPTAQFWRRRQVHETVMHLWDAQTAIDHPEPIEPSLAWDGVLEVRDVMYPRQVRLGRIEPLSGALHLRATDVPGDAVMGDGEPVRVAGGAETLLRLLWHRADPEEHVSAPLARTLLSVAVTP